MEIDKSLTNEGRELVLSVKDKLVADKITSFRKSYSDINVHKVRTIKVDLTKVSYIDSSGIGMLLVLKDFADQHDVRVQVSIKDDSVKQLFELANLDKMIKVIVVDK